MFMGTSTGMVSATIRPPASSARVDAVELARHAVGHARVDGEHVPVERSACRDRHRDEQVDLVVGELVEAAVDDAFERRALVLLRRPRTSASTSSCVAHRDGTGCPSPSECVYDERGREAEAAGVDRLVQQLHHRRRPARGVASLPTDVRAHHVAAQRAVADEEPGVHADVAVEPVEVVGEGLPVPVDAVLERGERHALDLRHHPADVVGVARLDRREGEAAVAADDRGHAVHVRRRGARVPEELGVVVGVRVDEARATRPGRWRRRVSWPARRSSPTATMRPSRTPTSAARPGAPVPSTTVPPVMR